MKVSFGSIYALDCKRNADMASCQITAKKAEELGGERVRMYPSDLGENKAGLLWKDIVCFWGESDGDSAFEQHRPCASFIKNWELPEALIERARISQEDLEEGYLTMYLDMDKVKEAPNKVLSDEGRFNYQDRQQAIKTLYGNGTFAPPRMNIKKNDDGEVKLSVENIADNDLVKMMKENHRIVPILIHQSKFDIALESGLFAEVDPSYCAKIRGDLK